MRLLSIASGSSGNSIYVGSDYTHILVDAGISYKRILEGLNKAEIDANDLTAICITHEHSDHIKSLGVIARKLGKPIYATSKTIEAIKKDATLGDYPFDLFVPIEKDRCTSIGDITVKPFSVHHDAADCIGYRFANNHKSIAIATDMGHYDDYIISNLLSLDALLLESNHDVNMLETGKYPYYLKRRILGEYGHLSNENCGRLLCDILHDNIKHVSLGHLSKENNYPDLALETVKCEITMGNCIYKGDDFDISIESREVPGSIINV